MVKWQGRQAVKYNGRNLDHATASAILVSSDSTYAFTVCLNHSLRVWNLTNGKLVVTRDLLDQERNPHESTSNTLNPANAATVKLVRLAFGGQTFVVTFSPHNEGYFKFWTIKGSLTSNIELEDTFPECRLKAPDPDPSGNSVWTMISFEVIPTESRSKVELWALWRNNNYHQLYTIKFSFADPERSWNEDWVRVLATDVSHSRPPNLDFVELCDPSTQWMTHLLHSGKYSTSVLETALVMYQDVLKYRLPNNEGRAPFHERLSYTVNACVNLRKYGNSDMDYDRFEAELDSQWQNYWRIAENLRERQAAPIALSLDSYTSMPWITMAGYGAGVRECNDIEILSRNADTDIDRYQLAEAHWSHRKPSASSTDRQRLCALVKTATTFRLRIPPEMLNNCQSKLATELYQESEYPTPIRLLNFYETCEFEREISDDTYDTILRYLNIFGGFQGLNNEIFYTLLDSFPENISKTESQLKSTDFGQELIANGARDIINSEYELLFGLFLLVIFLECEMNVEDTQNPEFDGAELYAQLQLMLREYGKKQWLTSNHRYIRNSPDDDLDIKAVSKGGGIARSLLHDMFVQDIRPQPASNSPQSFIVTQTIQDVIAWTREHDDVSFEDGLVHIQCDLIMSGDIELASDLLRLQPDTSWSAYVKGRLYLKRDQPDIATTCFQKAAHSLGKVNRCMPF